MKRLIHTILLLSLALVGCSKSQSVKTGYIKVSPTDSLYYEETGKGIPIILLHGHSLDTRMWDDQFETFSKDHRVVRFDFRGYGKSSLPKEGEQFTHLDDLLTLMDSLKIDKAHIVGLSMGAFIASDMLGLHPERMISCTLASGGLKTYKGPSSPMDSLEKAKRDSSIAALKAKGVDVMKREWTDALLSSAGSGRERLREPLTRIIDDWTAWQPLHYEPRTIYAADAAKAFYKRCPETPTLILQDMHGNGRSKMLDYLPNGRLVIMQDCGHMMNMEKPEYFNKVVLDFIKEVEASK